MSSYREIAPRHSFPARRNSLNAPLSDAQPNLRVTNQPTEADRAFRRKVTDRLLRRAIAVNEAGGDVGAILAVLSGFRESYCRDPDLKSKATVGIGAGPDTIRH